MEEDILKKVANRVLKEAGRIDNLVGEFSEVKEESSRTVDIIETRLQGMLQEFDTLKARLQSVEGQLAEAQTSSVEELADTVELEAMRREIEALRSQNEEFVHRNAMLQATIDQLKKEKAALSEHTGEITRFRAETNIGSATVVPREDPKGDYCLYNEVVPLLISYKRDIKHLETELAKKKGKVNTSSMPTDENPTSSSAFS